MIHFSSTRAPRFSSLHTPFPTPIQSLTQHTTHHAPSAPPPRQIVDLEESVAKKATAIEKLTKDVSRAEREGQVEARRLRVQLSGAEQEIAELKAWLVSPHAFLSTPLLSLSLCLSST